MYTVRYIRAEKKARKLLPGADDATIAAKVEQIMELERRVRYVKEAKNIKSKRTGYRGKRNHTPQSSVSV